MSTIIDTETHCFTQGFLRLMQQRSEPPRQAVQGEFRRHFSEPSAPEVGAPYPAFIEERLLDLGDDRVRLMDEHGIAAQVVSLTAPGTDMFEPDLSLAQAREANDAIGEALARHPGRFIGLASLAPLKGEESAAELERCVNELGFRGANIHSHVGDVYLDDRRCWPIFEAAEQLGVPINIHPTLPHASMLAPYLGFGWNLCGPGLGFGHEAAVQVSRMIYAGVFDEYPRLQIMLGHCGEALPFWMYRLDFPYLKPYANPNNENPALERRPSECLRENCWVNTSGNFFVPALMTCVHALGTDRILFASDYPYEFYEESDRFIASMPVAEADRAKIVHENAARLFGVELPESEPVSDTTAMASFSSAMRRSAL